jgi:hypothetical protein
MSLFNSASASVDGGAILFCRKILYLIEVSSRFKILNKLKERRILS